MEWVAIFSSRASSWPRDWTHLSCVSCTDRQFFTNCECGCTNPPGIYQQRSWIIVKKINSLGRTSLVVQGLSFSSQGAWVRSLVCQLGSQMPLGVARKKTPLILYACLQIWEYWWEESGFCWLARMDFGAVGVGEEQAGWQSFPFWWVGKFLSVAPWRRGPRISNCRDRELQVLGSEPSPVCSSLPWAAPRHWLCVAKTLSRPIPETPLMGILGSETAPWLCPTFLELCSYLGNVHPHLLPSFRLSFTQSQTCTMVRGLGQPFLKPSGFSLINVPPYTFLACFILAWCLLLTGPK